MDLSSLSRHPFFQKKEMLGHPCQELALFVHASLSSWGNLEKSGPQRYCPEGWWQWGFHLRDLLGTPMTAWSARTEVAG